MGTPIPSNMAMFSLSEILAATAGRVRGPLADSAMQICGISTDTRTLRGGEAFVALSGERFDGHEHLAMAASRGAVLALVEREVQAPAGLTVVQVNSTLEALGALAKSHLQRWREGDPKRKVVAITGSAGKTTTRQAIAALLEGAEPGAVHAAAGNLNNRIGVPVTVLGIADDHRYLVLELGTNELGEIGLLTRMVQPDVAVLTLIAAAHLSGLGNLETVAGEKASIFSQLGGEASVAVGNADDERVKKAVLEATASRQVIYGTDGDATYRILERRIRSVDGTAVRIRREDGSDIVAELALFGEAGALACAAALATVETMTGVHFTADEVSTALGAVAAEGRLRVEQLESGLVLLDDSYNANPASCRASIHAALEMAQYLDRRLVLILGEMRELGAGTRLAHETLGQQVIDAKAGQLIAVGGEAGTTARLAEAAGVPTTYAADSQAAAEMANKFVRPRDVVLIKGSRGIQTEKVVAALRASHTTSAKTKSASVQGKCAGVAS